MKIILLVLLLLLSGCVSFHTINRSGTDLEAYIEEPLSERSKKYEGALQKSNEAMRLLSLGKHDELYNNLLSSRAKPFTKASELKAMLEYIDGKYGKFIEFKPMQWWFFEEEIKETKLLSSIKLAKYEKGLLAFKFGFASDGEYKELLGISLRGKVDKNE